MKEIWKPVPGFGGHYEASSLGRVRAKARLVHKRSRWGSIITQRYKSRILRGSLFDGYIHINLGWDGVRERVGAHRLVAFAFHGLCPDGMECCHGDGVSTNNRPSNLRWATHAENNADRLRHGRYARGQAHPMAKFDDALLSGIRSGAIKRKEALGKGVSPTHFYRIKAAGSE